MGSLIGHRIDYKGVGVLRGQRHIPSKNRPKYPRAITVVDDVDVDVAVDGYILSSKSASTFRISFITYRFVCLVLRFLSERIAQKVQGRETWLLASVLAVMQVQTFL